MSKKIDISREEIEEIARKTNKTIDEVVNDYKYALKDLEYSLSKINSIIDENKYIRFPSKVSILNYGKNGELNDKYSCYDGLEQMQNLSKDELAIVTGFGPTNPPTAGTLASIFKVLELQKETGIYTHIIVSELSALNSRQKPLNELFKYTRQFIDFIKKLGFDENNGEIRTHNYLDHSRTFSIISSVFKVEDFADGEATDEMYRRLNLMGNDYSTMVSQAYTVADIVLPLMRDKKKGVIVPAGLEEHLYPYLARVAVERMKTKDNGISSLVDKDAKVGAVYGKLISGLFPYVKMSKSIKESSINLGDSDDEINQKIVNCGKRNEEVILEMMMLASNWNYKKIIDVKEAYNNKDKCYNKWLSYKEEYCEFFKELKKLWDSSEVIDEINTYDELFNK
ncbi:MAG: hypothetical protein IKX00_01545 [Bacilli bacterium]|nr:hypothetical protein [Bacilli bacterium]